MFSIEESLKFCIASEQTEFPVLRSIFPIIKTSCYSNIKPFQAKFTGQKFRQILQVSCKCWWKTCKNFARLRYFLQDFCKMLCKNNALLSKSLQDILQVFCKFLNIDRLGNGTDGVKYCQKTIEQLSSLKQKMDTF